MKFGACLKLSDLTADQFGPGTWDPDTGIYTTTLPGYGTCGAGDDSIAFSILTLHVKGCGVLRVTASATGYLYSDASASLVVYGDGLVTGVVTVVGMISPGGGDPSDACPTGPMTGSSTGLLPVDCGDVVVIQYTRSSVFNMGEITATVTVEVDTV